jgi:ribosomal protein S18 acetylase RimI-like enzyme
MGGHGQIGTDRVSAWDVEVGPIKPADWSVLRAARLRALLDSPHAFISRHAYEKCWSEREWRSTFEAAVWIVAFHQGRIVGLARSARGAGPDWERQLESIWVDPLYRRRGITRRLIEALIERERRLGVSDLLIWVLTDNVAAVSVYERLGFVPTGERQPLPDDPGRIEQRMRLRIS